MEPVIQTISTPSSKQWLKLHEGHEVVVQGPFPDHGCIFVIRFCLQCPSTHFPLCLVHRDSTDPLMPKENPPPCAVCKLEWPWHTGSAHEDPVQEQWLLGHGWREMGSWPQDDLRRAFVAGAKWWEYHSTKATMWQSDQRLSEEEAENRYPSGQPRSQGRDSTQSGSVGPDQSTHGTGET